MVRIQYGNIEEMRKMANEIEAKIKSRGKWNDYEKRERLVGAETVIEISHKSK